MDEKTTIKERLVDASASVKRQLTVLDRKSRGHDTKWAFWRHFLESFGRARVRVQASSLAFYFVFALFPFFIFVTAIVTRFSGSLATSRLWADLSALLPPVVADFLSQMLHDIGKASAIPYASVGFLGLLWSASRGINLLFGSLYRIYDRDSGAKRKFFQRLFALVFILLFAISVLLVLFLLTYGKLFFDLIHQALTAFIDLPGSLNWTSFLGGFGYLALLFALLYHFASGKRGRFRHAMVAALTTAVLWALSTRLFSYILARQTRYSVIFGGLTGILGLMLWLYLCSSLLLTGAVFHDTLVWWDEEQQQDAKGPAKLPSPAQTKEKRPTLRP